MQNRLVKTFDQVALTDEQKSKIAEVRSIFNMAVQHLDALLPENAEKTTALRKLREAKDCAIVGIIYPD